jgi:hypothetical protein
MMEIEIWRIDPGRYNMEFVLFHLLPRIDHDRGTAQGNRRAAAEGTG